MFFNSCALALKCLLPHSALTRLQGGYTLIELIIAVAVLGILSAIGAISYQTHLRKATFITIYQEINYFRMPYQIIIDEGVGVTGFSPSGLNMPAQTKYCQFSVTTPALSGVTTDAVKCTIQNLPYIQGQSLSLDRAANGSWKCRASEGIPTAYLPRPCQ